MTGRPGPIKRQDSDGTIENDREDVVALIDEYEMQARFNPSLELKYGSSGRKPTYRGLARKRVAFQLGLSPRTVADMDRAHHTRAEQARQYVKEHLRRFETFGLNLDPEWAAQVASVAQALRTAELRINSAATVLTKLRNSGNRAASRDAVQREIQLIKGRGEMLRKAMPRSLCPYCKGQPKVQEQCEHCHQMGWVGKLGFVPQELLERDPLRVHVGDKVVTLGQEPIEAEPEVEEADW